ncbi:hypothetical protein [Natronospirillum operosum]|nr:hypothetical protein [Natronospirillum operosum]
MVSIWLYLVKGVAFVSLGLATLGLLAWMKADPSHQTALFRQA